MSPLLLNIQALVAPALMERLVLVVNHVLSREALAVARLQPHQGRVLLLELQHWPRLLPQPPRMALRVTPAGLVEWAEQPDATPDLRVCVDASNPAALAMQALAGRQPPVSVEGDAQLAADVDWLLKNVRWDVADDLQRLFGPLVAGQLQQLGTAMARLMRGALQGLAGLAGRGGDRTGTPG